MTNSIRKAVRTLVNRGESMMDIKPSTIAKIAQVKLKDVRMQMDDVLNYEAHLTKR